MAEQFSHAFDWVQRQVTDGVLPTAVLGIATANGIARPRGVRRERRTRRAGR